MRIDRSEPASRFPAWLGGVAGAGVVAAHALAYLLAAPDPHDRHQLLLSSGHRYWVLVSGLALAGLAAGLARLTLSLGRGRRPVTGARLYAATSTRLAILQVSGFTVLESFERIFGGSDVAHLWGEPVYRIGLVVQVLVALVAAALLILFSRTVLAVKRRLWRAPAARRPIRTLALFEQVFRPQPPVAVGAGMLRGPPSIF